MGKSALGGGITSKSAPPFHTHFRLNVTFQVAPQHPELKDAAFFRTLNRPNGNRLIIWSSQNSCFIIFRSNTGKVLVDATCH